MNPLRTNAFDLPARLAGKSDPALIADDERHLAAIGTRLQASIDELSERLVTARRAPGGAGQHAMERDMEIHRLTAGLRVLRRFGLDVCLGYLVAQDDPEPRFIGRVGLTGADGRRLLVDWRAPAAEPFFAATHARPLGVARRRRYRWIRGRIADYWDEVFVDDGVDRHAALDDHSAFLAGLAGHRSDRMRDVLGTIAADQDAIIRTGSAGALVVDGGPGTGKTVVALHRAAYLLYSDRRVQQRRGGVLVVGPHQPYLNYVADVLPSLGEDGVQLCTIRDLVPEGAGAAAEPDPTVARLKSTAAMVTAIEQAVRFYEEPPAAPVTVQTPWADVVLDPDDWVRAFDAPEPGVPHNEAREAIWDEVVTMFGERGVGEDEDVSPTRLRAALRRDPDLVGAVNAAWPMLDPADVVGDLWSVPAYLRLCAPWLGPDEVRALQREQPRAWTVCDLPLLDAARRRLGDADAADRERRREAAATADRGYMSRVVDDLIAADDSEMLVMSMLRGEDLTDALVHEDGMPSATPDRLAGPFAHVIVDEAQELTDAEWQMLLGRCPSRSLTIVGDRAQARRGFAESWRDRLQRIGLDDIWVRTLHVNYRTPREVMAEAEPVIREVLPDATIPTSIREGGRPVRHGSRADRDAVIDDWLAANAEGTACVIGDPGFLARPRVRSLTPELAKGLEFDLVVLVDPAAFGDGIEGAVDRYVAMTRTTGELVVLT